MIYRTVVKNKAIFIILGLYLIGLALSKFLGISLILNIIGLFLIFILPGYLLLPVLNINKYFTKPFYWLLSIPISIAIFGVAELVFSKFFEEYTATNQILMLIVVNILVIIFALSVRQISLFSLPSIARIKLSRRWILFALLLSIPFLVLIISWIIYPFFPGDDTYILAGALKESVRLHVLIQPILERRPLFMPFMLLVYYGSGISIVSLFRFVLPTIVTLSFLLPANIIIKQAKEKTWVYLIFSLVFLASPYLIFQMQYTVPQSFILIFTIPVILLSIYGTKNRDLRLILIAIFISFIGIGFHELGFILLLSSLVGFLVYLARSPQSNKVLFLKKALVYAAIIFPYLIIFQIFPKLKNFLLILKYAGSNLPQNLQLQWWYVSYYLNPDGIVFSYPGWRGLLWYAYLGSLILVLFSLTLVIIFMSIKKIWFSLKTSKKNIACYYPIIFFTSIFLFVAEIYPRISKIAFLPERAWIFLSIGVSIIFILFINFFLSYPGFKKYRRLKILLAAITGLFVLVGIAGSIFLSSNRGLLLSKDELGAIKFIKEKTSEDSVIISTQLHAAGVPVFGERRFVNIPVINDISAYATFRETALDSYEKKVATTPVKHICAIYDLGGTIVSKQEKQLVNEEDIKKPVSVYFIYSLKRFDKLRFVGSPKYLDQNDYKNRDKFFKQEFIPQAVYKDKNVVVYKLK